MTLGDVIRHLQPGDSRWEGIPVVTRHLAAPVDDDLLALLKAESERYLTVDPHVALRLAEALIALSEQADRPNHAALGWMAKGDALRALGHYTESRDCLDDAGRAFLMLGDEVGWARTRIGWLFSSHCLGYGAEALDVAERAHTILTHHGEWLRAAALDLNTATLLSELGRYDQALRRYDRAISLYARAAVADPTLGDTVAIRTAKAQANKALVLTLRGDFRTAIALHDAARTVFAEHGEAISVLRQDQYIADVYAGQGSYTEALRRYGDVLDALDRAQLEADAGRVALAMIECYLGLNRIVEAMEFAEEAIARFDRCGTPIESAKARFFLALSLARLGDVEQAQGLLAPVAHTFASAELIGFLGIVTLQQASLALAAGNATEALQKAQQAREIFVDRGVVVRCVQAEIIQARAHLALGQHDEAAGRARSALATTRTHHLRWLAHESLHILATIIRDQGNLKGARRAYRAAIRSIERVQGRLATELRTNFLADKQQLFHDAIDCCLRLGDPAQAFAYLERAKSRALVDYLAIRPEIRARVPRHDEANRALLDALARLREEHHWFASRLYRTGMTLSEDDPRPVAGRAHHQSLERETLVRAIRERERRITRILERLALQDAEAIGVDQHPKFAAPAIPSIDGETVLLEYYVHPNGGVVFVVTDSGLTVVPLSASAGTIRRILSRWWLNVDAVAQAVAANQAPDHLMDNARSILQTFYQLLIQPAEAYLGERRRLIVIPYGITHAVPFQGFHDGHRYLIERLEISICPSSSLLRLCSERARRRDRSALVLAYSDGGRLPAVVEEARSIQALFSGECYVEEQATRSALLAAAARHGVLHLAAHGESRLDNPIFAHVRLADGPVSAVDVFNLDLDGALVTLSACESGQSRVVGADELIGLSRGFLYAGAATLVQSLWRVEDSSTAQLMTHFYRELKRGESKGAALREAQLAMLDRRGDHPYFWAPFQLVGDTGPL